MSWIGIYLLILGAGMVYNFYPDPEMTFGVLVAVLGIKKIKDAASEH